MVTSNDIKQMLNCKQSSLLTYCRTGFPKIPSDQILIDNKRVVIHQMNTVERHGDCLMLKLGKYSMGLNKSNLDRILNHSFTRSAR